MKKISGFEIKAEERQRWGSIAMVWIGSVICVPALMIGGMLGSGLSLGNLVLAILLGYALICVFMIFMGMLGCDTGLPTALMASSALGRKGREVYHQRHPRHFLHRLVRDSGGGMRRIFFFHVGRYDRGHDSPLAVLGALGHDHAAHRLFPLFRAEMAE